MKGVHKGATGVKVTLQGDVLDIGSVYWSSGKHRQHVDESLSSPPVYIAVT
jgi:hypothetical protein